MNLKNLGLISLLIVALIAMPAVMAYSNYDQPDADFILNDLKPVGEMPANSKCVQDRDANGPNQYYEAIYVDVSAASGLTREEGISYAFYPTRCAGAPLSNEDRGMLIDFDCRPDSRGITVVGSTKNCRQEKGGSCSWSNDYTCNKGQMMSPSTLSSNPLEEAYGLKGVAASPCYVDSDGASPMEKGYVLSLSHWTEQYEDELDRPPASGIPPQSYYDVAVDVCIDANTVAEAVCRVNSVDVDGSVVRTDWRDVGEIYYQAHTCPGGNVCVDGACVSSSTAGTHTATPVGEGTGDGETGETCYRNSDCKSGKCMKQKCQAGTVTISSAKPTATGVILASSGDDEEEGGIVAVSPRAELSKTAEATGVIDKIRDYFRKLLPQSVENPAQSCEDLCSNTIGVCALAMKSENPGFAEFIGCADQVVADGSKVLLSCLCEPKASGKMPVRDEPEEESSAGLVADVEPEAPKIAAVKPKVQQPVVQRSFISRLFSFGRK
ncbi:MAG: hypothetical protein ABIB71_01935 [Candidatus Woesearchaeota archaeon]